MQLKFIALLFALISLGSIGYCVAETADNYRAARRDFLGGNTNSYYSSRGSSDARYYDYRETMEYEVIAAGVGGVLGLILGARARKSGGGAMATGAMVASLAGLGGVAFVLSEYNGLF